MYHLRILQTAKRELEALDKPLGRRIAERIHWLAANLDDIGPEPYRGDLAGLYRLRVGDYRVINQIPHDERTIVIHQVGYRTDIYRKR